MKSIEKELSEAVVVSSEEEQPVVPNLKHSREELEALRTKVLNLIDSAPVWAGGESSLDVEGGEESSPTVDVLVEPTPASPSPPKAAPRAYMVPRSKNP